MDAESMIESPESFTTDTDQQEENFSYSEQIVKPFNPTFSQVNNYHPHLERQDTLDMLSEIVKRDSTEDSAGYKIVEKGNNLEERKMDFDVDKVTDLCAWLEHGDQGLSPINTPSLNTPPVQSNCDLKSPDVNPLFAQLPQQQGGHFVEAESPKQGFQNQGHVSITTSPATNSQLPTTATYAQNPKAAPPAQFLRENVYTPLNSPTASTADSFSPVEPVVPGIKAHSPAHNSNPTIIIKHVPPVPPSTNHWAPGTHGGGPIIGSSPGHLREVKGEKANAVYTVLESVPPVPLAIRPSSTPSVLGASWKAQNRKSSAFSLPDQGPWQVEEEVDEGMVELEEEEKEDRKPVRFVRQKSGRKVRHTVEFAEFMDKIERKPPRKYQRKDFDKDTPEYRARRNKNNVAVRKSRAKAKLRQEDMRQEIDRLRQQNAELTKMNETLLMENRNLKLMLAARSGRGKANSDLES